MASQRFRFLAFTLAVATLAACKVTPPTGGPRTSASTAPAPSQPVAGQPPGAGDTPTPVRTPGISPLTPPPATAVISNNGGTLIGKVKAPATLISDHGVGRRLLEAPAQVPVANAKVSFTDANGDTLVDAQGQPLTATTDATGSFKLEAALPENNVVVTVDLGAKGSLKAIAPKHLCGAPAASALPGCAPDGATRTLDVELVSTLTSSYILDQYVATQGDRIRTLDRLPADLEARTRERASEALARGTVAVPDTLTSDTIRATVDQLRVSDSSFDQQMEAVKRLLVAAGQSDLGDGQPATSVLLSYVQGLAVLPDGDVFFGTPIDARVWRLGKDGKLMRVVGGGETPGAILDGQLGRDAQLGAYVTVAADGDGLLVLEATRLSRLGTDGRLKVLWKGDKAVAVARHDDGRIWVLAGDKLWQAGKAAPLHTFGNAEDVRRLALVTRAGLVPGGPWRLAFSENGPAGQQTPTLLALDPVSFALTSETPPADRTWSIDQRGKVVPLDDVATRFTFNENVSFFQNGFLGNLAPIWNNADGTLLMGAGATVAKLELGQVKVVAGATELPDQGARDTIAFDQLEALAASPNGRLAALDASGKHRLWSIDPAGKGKVVLEWRSFDMVGWQPGELELDVQALRVADDGTIYLITESGYDSHRLWKLPPEGKLTALYPPLDVTDMRDANPMLLDFYLAPNGDQYRFVQDNNDERTYRVLRQPAGGGAVQETRLDNRQQVENQVDGAGSMLRFVATDPQTFFLGSRDGLLRWTKARGLEAQGTDVNWNTFFHSRITNDASYMVADSRGRIYGSTGSNIWRFDPDTQRVKDIIGLGTDTFTGGGTNTSVGFTLADPAIDAQGTLYFIDPGNRQVKQLPVSKQPL
jgi:hypothetical protein